MIDPPLLGPVSAQISYGERKKRGHVTGICSPNYLKVLLPHLLVMGSGPHEKGLAPFRCRNRSAMTREQRPLLLGNGWIHVSW